MATSKEISRDYNGSDAYMIAQAGITQKLFSDNINSFKAFDSTLTPAFSDAFNIKIQAAFKVVQDSNTVAKIATATISVEAAMETGRKVYNNLIYFVEHKAFPDNKQKAKEFGKGSSFLKASRSQNSFAKFLSTLYQTATKYKTELIASGCDQKTIDSILTAAEDLRTKDISQEVLKKGRPALTEDRIIILNECYKNIVIVNAAAQRVFADDATMAQQFVFKPAPKSTKTTVSEGNIAPNATVLVFDLSFEPERTFTIVALDTELTFGLSTDGQTFVGQTVSVPKGGTAIKKSFELNNEGNKLICKNQTAVAGKFNVVSDR